MECIDQSGQELCCVHTLSAMHEKALKPLMKFEGSAQPVQSVSLFCGIYRFYKWTTRASQPNKDQCNKD